MQEQRTGLGKSDGDGEVQIPSSGRRFGSSGPGVGPGRCIGVGEFCLCLDGIVQMEPIIHKGLPKLLQNVFPRELGHCIGHLAMYAPFFSIELGFLCFPCFRSSKEEVCTVVHQLLAPGANANT